MRFLSNENGMRGKRAPYLVHAKNPSVATPPKTSIRMDWAAQEMSDEAGSHTGKDVLEDHVVEPEFARVIEQSKSPNPPTRRKSPMRSSSQERATAFSIHVECDTGEGDG